MFNKFNWLFGTHIIFQKKFGSAQLYAKFAVGKETYQKFKKALASVIKCTIFQTEL